MRICKQTLLILLVIGLCGALSRADQTSEVLGAMAQKGEKSLVQVNGVYEDETGKNPLTGMGICIMTDSGNHGVFMTLAFEPAMKPEFIKNLEVVMPGVDGKTLPAKLLGVDPETGIGFVKSTQAHQWAPIKFAAAKLAHGKQVFSVGLMDKNNAHEVYVGTAYVSSVVRVPQQVAYLTGGRLTGVGSAVFDEDGNAIGLVGRQLFLDYQTATRRGTASLPLRSKQEASFFTPVEEFAHVIQNIPSSPQQVRTLPWTGALGFGKVTEEYAEIAEIKRPAVKVEKVVPGSPADKQGLAERDVIVALNGKPIEELATPELTARNFAIKLLRFNVGDTIRLTVLRGDKTKNITIKLVPMPTRPYEAPRYISRKLGFAVRERVMLDKHTREDAAADTAGLIVIGVAANSPADEAGLRSGDVITTIQKQAVDTVDAFRQILEAAEGGRVTLLVRRGDEDMGITLRTGS